MLFVAKAAVVVLAAVGLARATIQITNSNVTGNGTTTIEWTSTDPENDPVSFTIEFGNPIFNTQFGVGNNIPTLNNQITFQTPALLPGPNYTIRFVQNDNDSMVFAMTPPFTIAENDVSSSTQAPISGTTSVPLTSLSGSLSQSSIASTPGASNPSVTTPSPRPTSASSTSGSASASVFNGGGGGNTGAAAGLSAPAMLGISAASLVAAGVAAIVLA